jgi:hypothetical protein
MRSAASSSARRQAKQRAADRRLRALVKRLHGCLSLISPGSQRLLALRAGGAGSAPLSPRRTAGALHFSLGKEARVERRALASLEVVGRSGCGASKTVFSFAGKQFVVPTPQMTPAPGSSATAAPSTPATGVAATTAKRRPAKSHSRRGSGGNGATGNTGGVTRPLERASAAVPGTPSWAVALTLLAIALAAASLPLAQRLRTRTPSAAPSPEPAGDAAPAAVAAAGAGAGAAAAAPGEKPARAKPDAPASPKPTPASPKPAATAAPVAAAAAPAAAAASAPAAKPEATPAEPAAVPAKPAAAPAKPAPPTATPATPAGSARSAAPQWVRERGPQAAAGLAALAARGIRSARKRARARRKG